MVALSLPALKASDLKLADEEFAKRQAENAPYVIRMIVPEEEPKMSDDIDLEEPEIIQEEKKEPAKSGLMARV